MSEDKGKYGHIDPWDCQEGLNTAYHANLWEITVMWDGNEKTFVVKLDEAYGYQAGVDEINKVYKQINGPGAPELDVVKTEYIPLQRFVVIAPCPKSSSGHGY